MLSTETSDAVLASVIHALGHLHLEAAIGPVVALGRHRNPAVRWAVVTSLCAIEDERAVQMMIEASRDPDRDVRNWATFGIGSQIDTDTPAIREALVARLTDRDDEIRGEALVGLARRGDLRVVESFLRECDTLDPDILRPWTLIQDAAEAVVLCARTSANPAWLPILSRLRELQIGNLLDLQEAIVRCVDRSP